MMIYFMQNTTSSAVKIGYSRDLDSVKQRLKTMQTSHHDILQLLGVAPGNRRRESLLHQEYTDNRISGEWYIPNKKLLSEIKNMTTLEPTESDKDINIPFAAEVQKILDEQCMTIADLSFDSRVQEGTIRKIIARNCDPRLSTAKKIAKALNISLDDLPEAEVM